MSSRSNWQGAVLPAAPSRVTSTAAPWHAQDSGWPYRCANKSPRPQPIAPGSDTFRFPDFWDMSRIATRGRLVWPPLPANRTPARRGQMSASAVVARRAECKVRRGGGGWLLDVDTWRLTALPRGRLTEAMARQSEFTRRVLAIVRRIPPGRIATYGDVARLAGRPRAARAVGNIMRECGRPDVPCHRVVAAGGRLGGFGGNPGLKRNLLRAEGLTVVGSRIRGADGRRWPRRGR